MNAKWKQLRNFCTCNNLRVIQVYCPHKDIHTYTLIGRENRSIVDYIIINEKSIILCLSNEKLCGS
jgi:hypothetical protein